MKNIILFFIMCGFCSPAFSARQPIALDGQLKKNYLSLLEQAADIHKAMANEDEESIQKEVRETQEIISRLYSQVLSVSQFHHKIHSHKLLKSIEAQLVAFNSNEGRIKKKNVKKLFNSFFELAEVYDLKKDMKDRIFYCSKDRSLWFQERGRANNPINSMYKNCGRRVL